MAFIDQLRKAILLLSSKSDGEALAAARAIDRILKANDKDWHWLAEQIAEDNVIPFRKPSAEPTWNDEEYVAVTPAVEFILDNSWNLTSRDREFLHDMRFRYYHTLSPKQRAYLESLYQKAKWYAERR